MPSKTCKYCKKNIHLVGGQWKHKSNGRIYCYPGKTSQKATPA